MMHTHYEGNNAIDHDLCPCESCHAHDQHEGQYKYYGKRGCASCADLIDDLRFSMEFEFDEYALQEAKHWAKKKQFNFSDSSYDRHRMLMQWAIENKYLDVPFKEVLSLGEVQSNF